MSRRPLRMLGLGLLALLLLFGLRQALAPKETPIPEMTLDAAAKARLQELARASEAGRDRLLHDLRHIDFLLVGETHFYRNTLQYLTTLLDEVPERRISLLLELPAKSQPFIGRYLETGETAHLDALWKTCEALPYRPLLMWARLNRARVDQVIAMDENKGRIFINRAFLHDTRNATMAESILKAQQAHPSSLVVAYGGQYHMLLSGRYLYDMENRTPAGARLLRAGIRRERMRSLMLSGNGKAPICGVSAPLNAVAMDGPLGTEPCMLFIQDAIFRAKQGKDLFDYFVNLGDLQRMPEER